MTPSEADLIAEAWSSLVTGSTAHDPVPALEIVGASGLLPSRFAVEETALACVATALLAGRELWRALGGLEATLVLDREHVAAAVRSERWFRDGDRPSRPSFAPLSRFWRASDGWVRTHANYPWHHTALLTAIGARDEVDSVAKAIAERRAVDVEDAVFAAGGVAAAVRSLDEWRAHPQGRAVASEPLIGHELAGPAAPRVRPSAPWPAAGIRVLDLTRVIAGPVATRYLAALGAEVLRLDPPGHPDMTSGAPADMLLGKRSAALDAGSTSGVAALHDLVQRTDVLLCGYRPGSLSRFGLDPDEIAARHPGLVVVYLDAWGHSGPWEGRRGFDSVVQGPTGVAMGESTDGTEPGSLPCQLLDHGTGYLAAAAALDGLRRQMADGGTHVRRVSLARTAAWLTSTIGNLAAPIGSAGESAARWLVELPRAGGTIIALRPPGELDRRPLEWPLPVTGYTDDAPRWASDTVADQ